MKKRTYDPIVGSGLTVSGATNLWDVFVKLHYSGPNWHGNVNFAYAHKALLWTFESAMIYVAQVVGDKMNPPISQADACKIALPYFAWEQYYGSEILRADIWDPNGIGSNSTDPLNRYYVADGVFKDWVTAYQTCYDPKSPDCIPVTTVDRTKADNKLKRYFLSPPTVKAGELMNSIVSLASSVKWTPFITNNLHNGMHGYVGFSMARAATSADDILFWFHHCNVDRLLHLWGDCNGYDKLDPNYLICPLHYNTTITAQGVTLFSLDQAIGFASPYPFNLKSTYWPTPRQLWTMGYDLGTPLKKGWYSIYYRYGPDVLASSSMASVCPDQTWSWVNYAPTTLKRDISEVVSDDIPSKNYREADARFDELTKVQGMSGRDALAKMAMDDCLSSPTDKSPYAMQIKHAFSHYPMTRICDKEVKKRSSKK
jgi:hypothetical protein